MRRLIALAVALSIATPASTSAVDDDGFATRLAALQAADARVIRVGDRLARASVARCRIKAPSPGWIVADMAMYAPRRWEAVRAAYRLPADHRGPFVAAIAPDGAAAQSGYGVGQPLPDALHPGVEATARRPYAAVEAVHARWALPPPPFPAAPACHVEWRVDATDTPRARADGRMVLITRELVDHTASDDELAAVLAHEIAHHVAEHRAARMAESGPIPRTRDQEREADRLSIGLLHHAGYSVPAALAFWHRYARGRSGILNWSTTHDRWPTRIRAMESEWQRVQTHDAGKASPVKGG